MLKHKRGFTLVELMIVIALLGFGVVALANLFQSALRSFNKTEERYIKQEAVKSVAEYLQHTIKIGAATKVEIYPDSSVVPTVAGSDSSYAYIYVEKSDMDGDLINIGFMVFNPEIFDYLDGDETIFEQGPMNGLVRNEQLMAYTHKGYWQCMDTLREKLQLEKLWDSGCAPWKLWD